MSTTFLLLVITISMIVLVLLGTAKIIPECDDESMDARWANRKSSGATPFSCWPSDAPLSTNIIFLGFIQFMTWIVLGNIIPGSFGAFPFFTTIVS